MKRKITELNGGSAIVGDLPSGCQFCAKGSKMVLFVTGQCDSSCYYCPLSGEKAGKDVIFANETPITENGGVIEEADAIGAEGAGLSGGDPLCTLERTLHFIEQLKEKYGSNFHLHLYTSKTDATLEDLKKLKNAGLDEIRFHPQIGDWSGIEHAIKIGMEVGIEVPVIPGQVEKLIDLTQKAENIGVNFVNLNELEASETNFDQLVSMGFRLTSLEKASIEGSAETANEVLKWAASTLQRITVHFCSARYKDAVQLRNRLERRLERVIRPFEIRDDEDPLLILGVIRAPTGKLLNTENLTTIYEHLTNEYDVPHDLLNFDSFRNRIEIAPWIIEEISNDLKNDFAGVFELEIGIVYEYPTWDRLQTLFEPL
ncbi:MAG: radical SAM protein [Candidatus Thorarchaeota archaeon]